MSGTRREIILGGALGAGVAAFPSLGVAGRSAAPPQARSVLKPDGRLTVDRERAARMMKAAGIDVLVGASDINSRYLTNMRSLYTDMDRPHRVIGVMPADPGKPIVAIVAASFDIGRHAQPGREWPEIVTYSAPLAAEEYRGRHSLALHEEVQAVPARPTSPVAGQQLSEVEQLWDRESRTRPAFRSASPELALRRVLKEFGLAGAVVGVDDPGIVNVLESYGIDKSKLVDSSNLFRKLQMVKSAVEIDRMRVAAKLNAESARAMFKQLHPGMRYEDIQAAFFSEVVRRGGRPAVIAAGMVTGLRSGVLVKNEPTLIDAVGRFDGYCGDFGRTIVFGTPSTKLEQRMKAISHLVPATFDLVRPGVSYSQLVAQADEIVKKMNLSFRAGVGPHSVGMQHTDDARRDDLPFARTADSVLQAGMTITLDMPTVEPGWGATHMESLILVTKNGAEWLDSPDDPLHELRA
jgi:Xaa-Pro aminopeptidase